MIFVTLCIISATLSVGGLYCFGHKGGAHGFWSKMVRYGPLARLVISGQARQKGNRLYQAGNVFFALFGAVALVGVVGASTTTILKGPVSGMQRVTKYTIAENSMIAAGKLALMAAANQLDSGDCDGDTVIEPVPFSTTGVGPTPAGGGYLPDSIGAAKQDPWGNTYGYCVWDHGAVIKNGSCAGDAGRLAGSPSNDGIAIAVISSGPDRQFQTACGNHPDYLLRNAGSDDVVLAYTYEEARSLSGGLWNLKAGEPGTAEITKDIEVRSGTGDVVFGVDTRTDADRPSIKVDYIQQLSRGAVEYLSNIALGGNWLSGDGGDEGIYIANNGNVGVGDSAPSHKLMVAGQVRVDQGGSYDVWLQGGSATSGTDRNLALLGRKSDDRLIVNHSSEYTGGTQIGGPVYITGGALDMGGLRIVNLGGPSANTDAATKGYVDTKIQSEMTGSPGIPSGAVMAFNLNSCPTGWTALASAQGRFIVGVGDGYSRGNTGGANSVALTVAQLPAHNHSGTTSSAGEHNHDYRHTSGSSGSNETFGTKGGNQGGRITASSRTGIFPAGAHTHSFTTNNTGSGQAHENRPPYLALLYCQKS